MYSATWNKFNSNNVSLSGIVLSVLSMLIRSLICNKIGFQRFVSLIPTQSKIVFCKFFFTYNIQDSLYQAIQMSMR